MKVLLPRLASPAGFALALLFFLMPFAAVSCDAPGLGSVEVSYTGLDLATGADPAVKTEGDFGSEQAAPVQQNEPAPKADVEVLAIIAAVLAAAGLVVSLLPLARRRPLVVGGAAALAAVLLIVTEIVAQSNLKSSLIDAAKQEAASAPREDPFQLTESVAESMVQTRIGFWLALFALILVLLYNAAVVLLPKMRPATAAGPPVAAQQAPAGYPLPPEAMEVPIAQPPPAQHDEGTQPPQQ